MRYPTIVPAVLVMFATILARRRHSRPGPPGLHRQLTGRRGHWRRRLRDHPDRGQKLRRTPIAPPSSLH